MKLHTIFSATVGVISFSFWGVMGTKILRVDPLLPTSTFQNIGNIYTTLDVRSSRSWFHISDGMKFPSPLPLSGTSSCTKLRHEKRLPFFSRSSIRLWQWMSGMGKSRRRLTKVAHIIAYRRWNQSLESVEHRFFSCPLAQQRWRYATNTVWQLFAKRGNLGCKIPFLWCNAYLINLCAKHWNDLVAYGFSWGVVSRGLFGANGII